MRYKFIFSIFLCATSLVSFGQKPDLSVDYLLKEDSLIFKFKLVNNTAGTIGFFPNAYFSYCDRKASENCYCVKTKIGNKIYWIYPDASLYYPANEDTVWVNRGEQFQFKYVVNRIKSFFPAKSGVYYVVFIMPWILDSTADAVESNLLEVVIPDTKF